MKAIWKGKPSPFTIRSRDYGEGSVSRDTGEWGEFTHLGEIYKTRKYEPVLEEFQGDLLVFDENDYKICEINSTREYYDYTAHLENVIEIEQTEHGDLYIIVSTRQLRSSSDDKTEGR